MFPRPPRRWKLPVLVFILMSLYARGGAASDGPGEGPQPLGQGVVAAPGYGHLPLVFVENGGQAEEDVAFVAPGRAVSMLFGPEGVGLRLWQAPEAPVCPAMPVDGLCRPRLAAGQAPDPLAAMAPGTRSGAGNRGTVDALQLAFLGTRPGLRAEGRRPQRGRVSYFQGPESEWRRGLRTYQELVYRDAWPNIDVVYEAGSDKLKHRFIVHPGADPAQVRLAWRGATDLRVGAGGELVVGTPLGEIIDQAPMAYQDIDGRRVPVAAQFAPGPRSADASLPYGFSLGVYDPSATLVIDPAMVVYAGILGTDGADRGLGIAVDDRRNAYLTGEYGPDAFVAKVDPTGTDLVYLAVVGGQAGDHSFDIDVDARGAAYLTGATNSTDFPVKGGPDLTYGGGTADGFVVKLAPDGKDIEYAGFIGGAGNDFGEAIAVDEDGNVYASGDAESTERTFPVVVGPDLTQNGLVDAYVVKIKADPTAADPRDNFYWAGFIGGAGYDVAVADWGWSAGHLAIDKEHNVYLSNQTTSDERTFPDGNGFGNLPGPDKTFNGMWDAYVAKIKADGTGLAYAGYIGGKDIDEGKGMAVDDKGAAYLTGNTFSDETTFPVKIGPDLTYNGMQDGFVAKILPDGTGLASCGYFGGDDDDSGQAVALGPEPEQALYVAGWSASTEGTFPASVGPDVTRNGPLRSRGEFDAIVGRLAGRLDRADPHRNWDFLGYIGGANRDQAFWLDVDDRGDAYVAGDTWSDLDSFPGGQGMGGLPGLGERAHGDSDPFMAKIAFRPFGDGRTALLPSLGRSALSSDLSAGAPAAPSDTPKAIATRTATPTATPTRRPAVEVELPPGEELMFYDDFDDQHSGFELRDDRIGRVRYVESRLELTNFPDPEPLNVLSPIVDWGDGALEFVLERRNESDGFFVVNFGPSFYTGYQLALYPEGTLSLSHYYGRSLKTYLQDIRPPTMQAGVGANLIRIERYGSRVLIFVNDALAATADHPDLAERGVVRFWAVGGLGGPFTVRLDDLLVTRWKAGHPTPTLPPAASGTPTPTRAPLGTATQGPTPTTGPTVTLTASPTVPKPTAPVGELLFQDDFSNPASGWPTGEDETSILRYHLGNYEVWALKLDLFLRPLAPKVSCADCTVEVSAAFRHPRLSALGLVMTGSDPDDQVLFVLRNEGDYAVLRYKGDQLAGTLLSPTKSPAIKTNAYDVNRLVVVREGGKLSPFVNNVALSTLEVPDLAVAGRVGVLAGDLTGAGMGVNYDDFLVRAGAAPPPTVTPTATPSMTASPSPTVTPSPTEVLGELLLQDDFSDPGSGWPTQDTAEATIRYLDGVYEMTNRVPNLISRPLAPGVSCANCSVEVSGAFANRTSLGVMGLLLAGRDPNDHYLVYLFNNGDYLLLHSVGGQVSSVTDAVNSRAIKTGPGEVNRVKAIRQGGRLSLSVNGTALVTIDAPGLEEAGRLGVVTSAFSSGVFGVSYDDFVVRASTALDTPPQRADALDRISRPWRRPGGPFSAGGLPWASTLFAWRGPKAGAAIDGGIMAH